MELDIEADPNDPDEELFVFQYLEVWIKYRVREMVATIHSATVVRD